MLTKILIDDSRPLSREDFMALVRARAEYRCEECGKTSEELGFISYKRNGKKLTRNWLQGHHKDGNAKNNILKNGICLCATCHNKKHEKEKSEGLKKRNKNGQASRAGKSAWIKINSMSDEDKKKFLSDRANKIWETRRKRYGRRGR